MPERRVVRYALLDLDQLRAHSEVPDKDIQDYYNQHLDEYKLATAPM